WFRVLAGSRPYVAQSLVASPASTCAAVASATTVESAKATFGFMPVLPRSGSDTVDTRPAVIGIQGATAVAGICLLSLTACGGSRRGADWPLPNLDLASTRALGASGINRGNVGSLNV